jgi:hypothetical protein
VRTVALVVCLFAGGAGCTLQFGDTSCLHATRGKYMHYSLRGQPIPEGLFLATVTDDPRAEADANAFASLTRTQRTWGWFGWGIAMAGFATSITLFTTGHGKADDDAAVTILATTMLSWPLVEGILEIVANRRLRRAIERFNADAGEKCAAS